MALDIVETFETFDLILILVAFAIFARLAIRGKSLGNFRFQLSIFLLIWVLSEIPHIAESLGLIVNSGYDDIGLYLHALSMGVFSLFVGWRSIRFATLHPTPASSVLPIPKEPAKGIKG